MWCLRSNWQISDFAIFQSHIFYVCTAWGQFVSSNRVCIMWKHALPVLQNSMTMHIQPSYINESKCCNLLIRYHLKSAFLLTDDFLLILTLYVTICILWLLWDIIVRQDLLRCIQRSFATAQPVWDPKFLSQINK